MESRRILDRCPWATAESVYEGLRSSLQLYLESMSDIQRTQGFGSQIEALQGALHFVYQATHAFQKLGYFNGLGRGDVAYTTEDVARSFLFALCFT